MIAESDRCELRKTEVWPEKQKPHELKELWGKIRKAVSGSSVNL